MNLTFRSGSNLRAASMRPKEPSWMISRRFMPRPTVAFGVGDDEAEVGLHEALDGLFVPLLDAPCELLLLLQRQRLEAGDVANVGREGIARRAGVFVRVSLPTGGPRGLLLGGHGPSGSVEEGKDDYTPCVSGGAFTSAEPAGDGRGPSAAAPATPPGWPAAARPGRRPRTRPPRSASARCGA